MRALAILLALLFALAGCTDESENPTDPVDGETNPEPEPEPEPLEPMRDVVFEDSLAVQYGYDAGGASGCTAAPIGVYTSASGGEPMVGQDYDYFLLEDELHIGLNFTFSNTGSSRAAFIWVDENNAGIEWQIVATGATWEGIVPEEAYLGALSGCDAGQPASADVEIHDTIFV